MGELEVIEEQIRVLKEKRDKLLRESGLMNEEVAQILAARTPKRTLCQVLRELHDRATGKDREEIEVALLIAKKMNERLRACIGALYSDSWYDAKGNFIR